MGTLSFFQESLAINNNVVDLFAHATPPLTVHPGDTLVLGARQCSITALPGDYHYVIAADKLTLAGIAPLTVKGTPANPSPSVTVLAIEIVGPFGLLSSPLPGATGQKGGDGLNGVKQPGGKWIPAATAGEPGKPGGPGSPGGKAIIHYCIAVQLPTARAPGGQGGAGGQGGIGGTGPTKQPDGAKGAGGPNGAPGQSEVAKVDASQIWNALDDESEVEWAEFRGASITIWNRLEPRSRAQDLRAGLEARLFDPLWLLARQWQIGEFAGRDAGSPIAVDVTTTTAPFDRYAAGGATGQGYDGRIPLEVLIERETIRPPRAANDLRQAVEAGLHFGRLLDAAGLTRLRAAYLTRYPLPDLAGEAGPFGALAAGRVIDGAALHADLVTVTNTLPPLPKIAAADRPLLLPVVQTWLVWYGTLFSEPAEDRMWAQDRMEYGFSIGAPGAPGSFAAREYDGGTADWHTFDKAATTLTGGSSHPSTMTRRAVASPVAFRGMPARRYWELEDGSVDLGALTAGPEDLGRLLLREFALIFGTDWFLIPLAVPVGSVTNINALKVSDTFGVVTVVPHYSVADSSTNSSSDGAAARWRMFAISADESSAGSSPDYRLMVPPGAIGILDSEAIEDVLLLRDELADMVWGVEHRALGAAGVPVDRALAWRVRAPVIPASAAAGLPRYRLGSSVPDYWIPFLPTGPDNTHVQVRRGRLPTSATGPMGRMLADPGLTMFLDEIPREGVHLERRYRFARSVDGSSFLWVGRRRSTGRGEGRSGLRFDYLEEA
jgi:hypothetical protein